MAVVVEDGTGKSDATSYADLEYIVAYCESQGYTLPSEEPALEILANKAMEYIESLYASFSGAKLTKAQALQWPRSDAFVDGFAVEEDEIPVTLRKALAQLVYEIHSGNDPMPNGDGREIVREKIDVIETEYAPTGTSTQLPSLTKVNALLERLFDRTSGSSYMIPLVRS
jgi:hypothetical protein